VEGVLISSGHVGGEVAVEVARDCARACALNALAAAATVCDLDRIRRVVKVTGYVSSAPGFTAQPRVIDAASEVFVIAFGDSGKHAREAVGVAELPLGAPVEVSVLFELG
jgi:enamine deaminase RidA (YjgF/YER057c/UK114 family)